MISPVNLRLALQQLHGYTLEKFQKQEADLQGKDYELTNTHVDIYNGYTVFMKWGTLSVIGVLILMAIFLL